MSNPTDQARADLLAALPELEAVNAAVAGPSPSFDDSDRWIWLLAHHAPALLAAVRECEELRGERDDWEGSTELIAGQSELLIGVVNAIRGDPPVDTLWSHHDAPELARALRAENDRLKAAYEELDNDEHLGPNAALWATDMRAENERLRGELESIALAATRALDDALADLEAGK